LSFYITVQRLENQQSNVGDRKSSRKHKSESKHTRKNKDDSPTPDDNLDVSTSNNPILSDNQIGIKEKTTTEKGYFSNTILFIGIFLLFLHIYLCYKLYDIDQALYSPDQVCLNECKKSSLFYSLFSKNNILFVFYFSLFVTQNSSINKFLFF